MNMTLSDCPIVRSFGLFITLHQFLSVLTQNTLDCITIILMISTAASCNGYLVLGRGVAEFINLTNLFHFRVSN